MNVPNALTLLRIFFVPILVAALVQEDFDLQIGEVLVPNSAVALAIFLTAALTDLIDGYLARKWGQVTTVGTLLDPIADKLLVSAALVSLVQVHAIPGWMAILIIGREFAISGLRSIAAAEGYVIRASDFGKLKTVSQVFSISLVMVSMALPRLREIAILSMWVVVAITMLSAVSYFRKFWRKVDDRVKRRRRREFLKLEREQRRPVRQAP